MSRKTYVYDKELGKMVEGQATPRGVSSGDAWMYSDRHYSEKPFTAHDGTVIDSRAKHRAYMRRHNLTTIDDFPKTWEQKQRQRDDFYLGRHKPTREQRKRDIIRTLGDIRRG